MYARHIWPSAASLAVEIAQAQQFRAPSITAGRFCGQEVYVSWYKWALRDFRGPGVVAEPSAGDALGIAARLLMSGTTRVAIMCVFMLATYLSCRTVSLTSAPATLQIHGGSKLVLIAWLGYMLIQYVS